MNSISIYLIETAICLVLFYSIYKIFLQKETLFKFNRYYIMATVLLSFIIPALNFSYKGSSDVIIYNNVLNAVVISADGIEQIVSNKLSTQLILTYLYAFGVVFFTLRLAFQIFQLLIIIKKGKINHTNNLRFVITNKNISPFTFFNIIFLNNSGISEKNMEKIIAHEHAHVKQLHFIDLIILELLTIAQWFNPFIWKYRKSLKEVHEYLADEDVLKQGYDSINYQKLIFNSIAGTKNYELTSNFDCSLTKKRLIMMTKIKTPKWAKLKALVLLPIVALLVLAFACSEKNEEAKITEKTGKIIIEKASSITKSSDSVYYKVDEMPEFEGGTNELIRFIAKNTKYPKQAKEDGIQGKVYVSFIVNKTGKVVDVKALQTRMLTDKDKKLEAPLLEEEAVRVISLIPDWKPGKMKGEAVNVQFTIPINFKLN
ncbi:MAG: M56 family metallopeptidase [Bacteroidetes bacterium]|nr:M56 family metallopeptidase [Bacteroidota bacterium]